MNTPKNADGFAIRLKRPQRGQVMTHVCSLDEAVGKDHVVRDVWRYVNSLDLTPFYREVRAVKGGRGRDAVDPGILLALWIFATIEGIGSAREIARRCERDFAYRWICGEVPVDRELISSFRREHGAKFETLMIETIAILRKNDLVSLERVAQDGMRVRASAGKSSFHRKDSLNAHLEEARKHVETLRQRGDDDDAPQDVETAARKRAAEDRLRRLEQAIEERNKLEEEREKRKKGAGSESRCSTTDPEARVMKMGDNGYRPAYNVQLSTACDSLIIVGVDVINQGSDSGQIKPMLDKLSRTFGERPAVYLVDGGFNSRGDITNAEREGTQIYAPVKKAEKLLDEGKDPYARRPRDTDEYYNYRQRMKTDEAQEIYRQRCSTAEFPNAGFRNRGLQQFNVRGKAKAKACCLLQALTHNLQMILFRNWLPTVTAT